MHVYGPSSAANIQAHGPHGLKGPHSKPAAPASSTQPADQLDISAAASAAADTQATGGEGIRASRVAEIRSQIANGSYDTDEKLSLAVDRLLDQIG